MDALLLKRNRWLFITELPRLLAFGLKCRVNFAEHQTNLFHCITIRMALAIVIYWIPLEHECCTCCCRSVSLPLLLLLLLIFNIMCRTRIKYNTHQKKVIRINRLNEGWNLFCTQNVRAELRVLLYILYVSEWVCSFFDRNIWLLTPTIHLIRF